MSIIEADTLPIAYSIVPVVFITEPALINSTNIDSLTTRILHLLNALTHGRRIAEYQFDCDWSNQSREKYFRLLANIRNELQGATISATIRLHQIKYRLKTGIPPVDRGMLMLYNMSDWRSVRTRNSIFDLDELDKYTDYIRGYSLPLDVALPVYHWGIVYRNDRFLTILNNYSSPNLERRIVIERDTTIAQAHLYPGDVIRYEDSPVEDVTEGLRRVLARIRSGDLSVALYHLDARALAPYSYESLESLFTAHP